MSGLSMPEFEERLLKSCGDILTFARVDQAQRLTASALDSRRKASDVWGGRAVWRTVSTPGPRGGRHRGDRKVFWPRARGFGHPYYPYYSEFTFMLDASALSTAKPAPPKKEKAYQRVDTFYPPELVKSSEHLSSALWVMFYIVIHPKYGVVVPPSFMYWGSKTKRGAQRHTEEFLQKYCWCACAYSLSRLAVSAA